MSLPLAGESGAIAPDSYVSHFAPQMKPPVLAPVYGRTQSQTEAEDRRPRDRRWFCVPVNIGHRLTMDRFWNTTSKTNLGYDLLCSPYSAFMYLRASRSAVGQPLQAVRIPGALHRDRRGRRVDVAQVVCGELDRRRAEVFLQALQLPSCPGSVRSMASAQAAKRVRFVRASPVSAVATFPSRSTRARFACRASGAKRGIELRMSLSANAACCRWCR